MSAVDTYLERLSAAQKSSLERLRKDIQQLVPEAEETISYGMPAFRYKGRYLIGYAAFKQHMSIFPGALPVETLQDKLIDFKTSKGTIQFTEAQPLPAELVKEIVTLAVQRIDSPKSG